MDLAHLPAETVADILSTFPETRRISRAISKDVRREAIMPNYNKYREQIVPLSLTPKDVIDIATDTDCSYYYIEQSKLGMRYMSTTLVYSTDTDKTYIRIRTLEVDWDQSSSGRIKKVPIFDAGSYNNSDWEGDRLIENDVNQFYYMLDGEVYTLTSLPVTQKTYYGRLVSSELDGDINYQKAELIWDYDKKVLTQDYYLSTIKRLEKYDKYLLLLFLVTEYEFELISKKDYDPYIVNFDLLDEQIEELKDLLMQKMKL